MWIFVIEVQVCNGSVYLGWCHMVWYICTTVLRGTALPTTTTTTTTTLKINEPGFL